MKIFSGYRGEASPAVKRIILIAFLLLFAVALFHPVVAEREVRVALQHIPPSVYTDSQGEPTGIFVDLIQDIASKEGWNLVWVSGTLTESWDRLSSGKVDLLMSVTSTPERGNFYDFSHEPAISVWTQVYAPPGSGINTILDLDKKRVAMLKGDINTIVFRDYAGKFGIDPVYVEFNTLDELFAGASAGQADAVVAFNIAGKESANKYSLVETNILFNPTALGFAVAKGKNQDLLSAVDRYLLAGKSDPSSYYSRTMQKWFGMEARWTVPYYLWWGLGLAIGLVALFVLMSVVLKREVRKKTAEISLQNEELRSEIARRAQAEKELLRKNEELQAAYEEMTAIEEELRTNYEELGKTQQTLTQARKKLTLLNTFTFQELQNGIFSLNGFLDLANDAVCSENGQTYLKKVQETMYSIENSLRIAKNYQQLGINKPKWQDMNSVFLYAISHLDFSGIKRTVELDGLLVYADPLLENVFYEMMKNVIQHGGGADTVSLTYRKDKDGIAVLVEDNGPGIPSEDKERIFEEQQPKKKGFGLFLAREILSITGISIKETGETGKGARFEIIVPGGMYRFPAKDQT